jgi:AsmA protein
MKRIGIIVGIVVVVLLGAVLVIPNLIPADVYRSNIQTAGSKALGRDVKVGGKVGVSIFPRIEARAEGGTIANPAAFGEAPFASMKEVRAAVKLIPLLFGKVEIDEFVLVDPKIDLIQLENGANNWTFDLPKPEGEQKPTKPGESISASLGDVRIINGQVSFDDRKAKSVHTLTKFDLKAKMDAIDKPFTIESQGVADTLPFKFNTRIENPKALMDGAISKITADLDTHLLKTKLDGQLGLGDKPTFDFAFDGEVPSAVELADAFQVKDLPARNVLGKLTASGQAFGNPSDITLKLASARHESPLLNADLKGEARVAEFITLALEANADVPKLAELAKAMAIEAPAGEALGKATAKAKINGKLGDLTFSDVDFRHDSGLLKLAFTGGARLNSALTYDGHLSINAPDLRQLASAAGAKLPEGDVYKSFSLAGDTSGGTTDVLLKNAVVQFDNMKGTGEAALALGGARPRLTGSLTTGDIDITPYAKSSGAPTDKVPQKEGDWGATPVDLTPLKLADADLNLKTGGIKYDKFDFGPSNIGVTLKNGRLVADLKQSSLFGGAGTASVTADGSGQVPGVAIKANFNNLALKPFMQAAAGFDMVEGKGDVNIDIAGSGATVQNLMSSLGGNGKFGFDDGAINGVNLTELGNAAKTALSSKSISLAAFGANQKTTFNNLGASFAMKDGVAAMADLKMDSGSFTVSGGGSLDIGKQKLSLSLFPEFKDKKQGLNGYGLPLKLAGGWNGVGLALDWDWLAKKATADVKAKVSDEIQGELQKQLGGKLGDLLGKGGKAPAAAPAPAAPAETPAAEQAQQPAQQPAAPPASQPKSLEEKAKEDAKKALNKLLGKD